MTLSHESPPDDLGVKALNAMAIDFPADAMRAIQLAIREERVALGEPTDRTAVSVEETIRREYDRWMTVAEDDEEVTGHENVAERDRA